MARSGYSTICLAEGLAEGGTIDTLEINDELEHIQDEYWEMAGLKNVTRHIGHAHETIASGVLEGPYDLIWIDADKEHQISYVDFAVNNLRIGGCLMVDNVIWGGAVLDKEKLAKPTSRRVENSQTKPAHSKPPSIRECANPGLGWNTSR